jgi:hypothetical protein
MSRPEPPRVSGLLGRAVHDRTGALLGRVADVETATDDQGRERVVALIVTAPPWGRLLGYERDEVTGPRLIEVLAHHILRRNLHRVPWSQATLDRPPSAGQHQ